MQHDTFTTKFFTANSICNDTRHFIMAVCVVGILGNYDDHSKTSFKVDYRNSRYTLPRCLCELSAIAGHGYCVR